MVSLNLKNWLKKSCALFISTNITEAFASTSGNLPFNSTMNILKDAISGSFLLSAAIIMIVITCLMLAFGEWGDGFKKFINIVLWLSIAFAATSFITTMFGGGAVC
jgi:type IV secretory pathway VirB2 component (pilin)